MTENIEAPPNPSLEEAAMETENICTNSIKMGLAIIELVVRQTQDTSSKTFKE